LHCFLLLSNVYYFLYASLNNQDVSTCPCKGDYYYTPYNRTSKGKNRLIIALLDFAFPVCRMTVHSLHKVAPSLPPFFLLMRRLFVAPLDFDLSGRKL